MIKYIVFDLAEVIISGYAGVETILGEMLNLPSDVVDKHLFDENFLELMRGKNTENEYFKELSDRTNWDISVNDLKEICRKNFENEVPGVKEVILELKKKYKLVLLSDHVKEWIEYILNTNDFLDIFDEKYFSYEFGSIKSEGKIFKEVLENLGVNSEEILFIDDSEKNVEVAKNLNIDAIVFKDVEQLVKELEYRNI